MFSTQKRMADSYIACGDWSGHITMAKYWCLKVYNNRIEFIKQTPCSIKFNLIFSHFPLPGWNIDKPDFLILSAKLSQGLKRQIENKQLLCDKITRYINTCHIIFAVRTLSLWFCSYTGLSCYNILFSFCLISTKFWIKAMLHTLKGKNANLTFKLIY